MATEPLDAGALEAGERLLANTTPAGWEVYDQPHSDTGWRIFGPDGDGLVTCHGNTGYGYTGGPPGGDPETDARALVWLRNHAPALIAQARAGLAAEQEVARLRESLQFYANPDSYRGVLDWQAGIPFWRNEPISNDIGQRARDALEGDADGR